GRPEVVVQARRLTSRRCPLVLLCTLSLACSKPPPGAESDSGAPSSNVAVAGSAPSAPSSAPAVASGAPSPFSSVALVPPPPPAGSATSLDDRPLHMETLEQLLSLFPVRTMSEREIKKRGDPSFFLNKNFGPDTSARVNQGNKALAHHAVTREACLQGLR